MSVPQDELQMLQLMASQDPGALAPAAQPQGMVQTDPGNLNSIMQNQQLAQQLGGSSADIEKRQALAQQMAMAKYLGQGANMPRGTHIPGYMGGVYVAPNALQDTAAVAQHLLGAYAGGQASSEEMAMAQREARNRTAIMNMINEQNMRPPMYSPNLSDVQNPLENYDFGAGAAGGGGPPRNTNLQPQQQPPRQMTPDEFAALQYPSS